MTRDNIYGAVCCLRGKHLSADDVLELLAVVLPAMTEDQRAKFDRSLRESYGFLQWAQ